MSQGDLVHYPNNLIDRLLAAERRIDDLERKVITSWGDITGTDYSEFEADGTLVFNGAATVWEDLSVSLSSVKLPAVAAPTWVTYKGSRVLSFSGTATNTIYFETEVLHSYHEGEDIEFHIHWVPEDDTAGNTRWVFTYSWANIDAAFPGETTATAVIAATPEVTDQHTETDIVDITGTGKTISSVLLCSLARTGADGDDTYNAKAAYLVHADFHFPINTVGSRTEHTK